MTKEEYAQYSNIPFKVELAAKVWAKSLALEKEETAVEPSGWSKGGKVEEVKLLEILLGRYQKSREELELEKFWHFLLMKMFLVSLRRDLAWLQAEICSAWVSADGGLRYHLWAASLSLTAREQT